MVKKPELNNVWGKAVLMNTLSQCPYNVTEENNNKRTGSNNFFFHSGLKQLFLKQGAEKRGRVNSALEYCSIFQSTCSAKGSGNLTVRKML